MVGRTGLSKRPKPSCGQARNNNRLRIIGGQWRGRKLDFPDLKGLRPTPDRVRETLFNWLQNDIVGARCLDLFAGSGALGLEALSRGAIHTVLVEKSALAAQQLDAHLHTLRCDNATVVRSSAEQFLQHGPGDTRYDVVFLDPPFGEGLISVCAELLEKHHWLAAGAHIYLEMAHQSTPPVLPGTWQRVRDKTAGHVSYQLVTHASTPKFPAKP